VAAHLGASWAALENSLAALRLALAEGADLVECDVRLSADGEPFVIHDERTGRTARENVRVDRCPAAALARVRLKNGEPLPRLADVLDALGGAAPLVLDLKSEGGAAAAARVLAGARYRGPVLFSSALRRECLAARSLAPARPCALVTRRPSASDLAFCRRHGLVSIHPDRRLLTVVRLRRIVEAGVPFLPYTVDDPQEFRRLASMGAAGVFSSRPKALREAWRAKTV